MNPTTCRWGILGTASIARKNWQSIRLAGNSELVAVASRDVERARQFIDSCQSHVAQPKLPQAVGRYEALLANDQIDAVYIPLPTGLRTEWVIRAAEAGKHVLVEKPCGVTANEVRQILDACRRHHVQFMDGVMFMHSERLPAIRSVLDSPQGIGRLRRIASQFSFLASSEFLEQNIRLDSGLEPLGCLGDLGWYNIRITLWAANWQLPERVTGRILASAGRAHRDNRVPIEFSGEMLFRDGVSASFYCSFVTEHQQWVNLSGTEGHLQWQDFVLPEYGCDLRFDVCRPKFAIQGCQFNMEMHRRNYLVPEYSNNAESAQEVRMFQHFAQQVLSGSIDDHWGKVALRTQQVMDACLASARDGGREVVLQD